MKIDRSREPETERTPPKESFAKEIGRPSRAAPTRGTATRTAPGRTALPASAGRAPAGTAVAAVSRETTARALSSARAALDARASALVHQREQGHDQDEARRCERVRGLIDQALRREDPPASGTSRDGRPPSSKDEQAVGSPSLREPAAAVHGANAVGVSPARPVDRAGEAMALIEKIQVMIRDNRPALSLSLHGALAAQVEIVRTGPGAVSLTLVGRGGPPRPADVASLRGELARAGIVISRLQIGR